MRCPKCDSPNEGIETIDHIKYFACITCGYKIPLKNYKAKIKEKYENLAPTTYSQPLQSTLISSLERRIRML